MAFLKIQLGKRGDGEMNFDPKGKTIYLNVTHIQAIEPYPARTGNGRPGQTKGTVIATNHSGLHPTYELATETPDVLAAAVKALHETRQPFIECPTGKPEDPPAEKEPEAKPPAGTAPAA